jgi:hypothetical protein
MEVIFKHKKSKKPGYGLKIFGAIIRRKGRILAELTDEIEFKEEDKDGSFRISFR